MDGGGAMMGGWRRCNDGWMEDQKKMFRLKIDSLFKGGRWLEKKKCN